MPQTHKFQVQLRSRNDPTLPSTTGEIEQAHYSKPEQLRNSVRGLGLGLALTAFGALIPIAHWLLVPLGLLATGAYALHRLSETKRSLGGSGTCPNCQKTITLGSGAWSFPLIETCENCHQEVKVHLESE